MALIRIKFSKCEDIKYISHLDLQRTLHRMFRRAGLNLVYSQGFNPHPKVSFAMAMPVGMTSEGEYVDVEIQSSIDENEIMKNLNDAAPKGLNINKIGAYNNPVKNLSAIITQGTFLISISLREGCNKSLLQEAINEMMNNNEIIMDKKNKKGKIVSKDIRPLIKDIMIESVGQNIAVLNIRINIGSQANLNPQMIIDYFIKNFECFKEFPPARIHRLDMYTEEGTSPLEIKC